MSRKFVIACLLCTVLLECVSARPSGCHDNPPRHSLEKLIRRGAAIASSLRNLRSVRERRWGAAYPLWKSIHRTTQHRAMDITKLPPIPAVEVAEPNTAEFPDEFHDGQSAVAKDLNIGVEGFWHDEPFKFPGLMTKPPGNNRPEEVSETDDSRQAPSETAGRRWGGYREPLVLCNDDIAGSSCTSHSDCQGCRDFHCSSDTNRCEAGPEPDPYFAGFL